MSQPILLDPLALEVDFEMVIFGDLLKLEIIIVANEVLVNVKLASVVATLWGPSPFISILLLI